jgi:hypothetical protein
MRECFTERGGVEIDTQGDAFFFAFPRARDAVASAVEAQRLHASHEWPDSHPVRVRMGLHTGEPAVGSEGYLGIDVVRAARLCTIGRGGQVVLSETTRALVGGALPEGVSVHALGERRLKDIDEPERVFELDIVGAPVADAPVGADLPADPPADLRADLPADRPPAPPTPPDLPASTAPLPPDFGTRLAEQIQQQVRRKLEPLERLFSEVDVLADRAAQHPETVTEKLEAEGTG